MSTPENQTTDYKQGWRHGFSGGFAEGVKAARKDAQQLAGTSEGVSSKDREFIELQEREQRARSLGYTRNDYICIDCLAEGKTLGNSTYLDWPASYVNGETRCSKHAELVTA